MSEQSTVVLVHGAWHGAWCWDEVASRLSGDGALAWWRSTCRAWPRAATSTTTPAPCARCSTTPRATSVVVGHSYGGIVITEAAAGADGVRHLVYLTAFMLDEGESLADYRRHARRPRGRSRHPTARR